MKKLSKLLALAAGFATLFFAACSDINDVSGTMSNVVNDKTSNEKKYEVSFEAADGSMLELDQLGINSNKVSRTIVADAVDISSGVKFYIYGKDEINTSTNPVALKEVTFVPESGSTTKGTVVLDYSASKYFFVLYAVNTADVPSSLSPSTVEAAAIYRGYANVDLRNGDAIKFYISADGLAGPGSFKLTIKADSSWTAEHLAKVKDDTKYTITAGLYNRETGEPVSSPSLKTVTNATFVAAGEVWTDSSDAGTYNFVVKFIGPNSKTYEYSDVIIILPKREVVTNVEVPDVIEYAPLSPSAFKAAYIAPTVATTENYNVMLQWNDNSKNERYFKIEYVDVSAQEDTKVNTAMQTAFAEWRDVEEDPTNAGYATKKTAADTAWATAITGLTAKVKTLDYSFYGNTDQNWVAGSLQRNNKNILMRLALGKRYIFRIAAVNDAGDSDNYSYATYDTNLTWVSSDSAWTQAGTGLTTANAFKTKKANISAAATYDSFTLALATPSPALPAGKKFFTENTLSNPTEGLELNQLEPGQTYFYDDNSTAPAPHPTEYVATPTNIPAGATKFYAESDSAHATLLPLSNLRHGTTYSYEKTPATTAGYDDATSLTANLYRLTYHLNNGTYYTDASTNTTDDIVEYMCQGDIDLKCPSNPPTGSDYPQLKNTEGKRWTAWKQGSIVGANYGVATTNTSESPNFTYYDPGDYTGYANLELFASYNLSNASVEAYNDSDFDFKDTDAAHPAVSITTTTGVTKGTNHYYTVVSTTAKVTFRYEGSVEYSSLKAVVKRGSSVVGAGNFSSSKTFDLETKSLPLGTYNVLVYGEYKGHTYQYSITVVLEDA